MYDGTEQSLIKLYKESETLVFDTKNKGRFNKRIPFISLDNEKKAWQLIKAKSTYDLQEFKTTIE